MTKNYTAADFANARFAEHPDGRLAHRVECGTVFAWSFERNDVDDYAADEYMAEYGWVPVPTKPTLTAGAAGRHSYLLGSDVEIPRVIDYLEALGIEVTPDPEPTNAKQIEEIIGKIGGLPGWERQLLAEELDKAGVKAPEGNA